MHRPSRLTLALLAFALLSASPALPQAGPGVGGPPRTTSLGAALLGLLPHFLVRLWEEAGCGGDPFGTCRPEATARPPQEPLTSVQGEAGCLGDPYGRCLTSATTPQPPSGH
jgi:hypothetical protein